MKSKLTIPLLIQEAEQFCIAESNVKNKSLFGVTDGKAVGTHIEDKFKNLVENKYRVIIGSSANGIDLPSDDIQTDIKVTSIKQPQSSCPFKSAQQKIFGLGYNLLIFVYDKKDNPRNKTATLNFVSCSFILKERTADYTMTYRLRQMVDDGAKEDDILSFLTDRNLPADEVTLSQIVKKILKKKPAQGYLTISNALQWRLHYQRIVDLTHNVDGITKIIDRH